MKPPDQAMLRIGAAAKKLGYHPQTLRRWMGEGKLVGIRMGKEVRIPLTEIERLLGEQTTGTVVLYARVSGTGQRHDLTQQVERLQQWADQERPQAPQMVYRDIGSGLHTERAGLRKLIRQVQDQQVREVAVTYADRLTRFGFAYLQTWFAGYGAHITVLSEEEERTPEREVVDDLLAILTSFSGRLYGMRSDKQQALVRCAQQVLNAQE
ncbi:MAG: IS607 family transposase [Chitinophagaceae bacterium]